MGGVLNFCAMKKPVTLGLLLSLACSASLSGQGFKYSSLGNGISFTAADSSVSVKMSARIQNLLVVEQSLTPTGATDVSAMTRRARFKFDGFAISPALEYKIELGLSNRDISATDDSRIVSNAPKIIYDAVLKYEFMKGTSLWFGQTKLPGNRERVISSQKLQFVDRSLVNSRFNIDRDFGIQLHSSMTLGQAVIKPIVSLSLGEGRNVTVDNHGGFNYTGRVEFLPFGEFINEGDYFSSDLEREQEPKLSLGVTADYNQGTIRQGGQLGDIMIDTSGNFVEADLLTFFADVMFKYRGLSVLAEAAYRESSRETFADAAGNAYNQGFGYTAQAGYLFTNNIEVAGRYTRTAPNTGSASSIAHEEQYTLGVSKFFKGHNLKLQGDLTYERNLNSTFANENLIFRLQTELSF